MMQSEILTMRKKVGGKRLIVAGHFNKAEIQSLKSEGYKISDPPFNKNGIRIDRKRSN